MPEDYVANPKFFLWCLVQNSEISFEFYVLKIYLVCWFPYHLGDSIF